MLCLGGVNAFFFQQYGGNMYLKDLCMHWNICSSLKCLFQFWWYSLTILLNGLNFWEYIFDDCCECFNCLWMLYFDLLNICALTFDHVCISEWFAGCRDGIHERSFSLRMRPILYFHARKFSMPSSLSSSLVLKVILSENHNKLKFCEMRN